MVSAEGRCQWKQWLAALAAILPMVIVGFLGVLVSVSVHMLRQHEDLPEELRQGAILLTISGCVIGAIFGAILADKYGRKKTLLATTICIVGGIINIFLQGPISHCITLCIGGINAGIVCTVVPLYISEIADDRIRGRLLMLQLLGIYMGQFIVIFAIFMEGPIVMDVSLIVIPILFIISIYWFPESPYYLASKKHYEAAAESLAFFKGIDQSAAREEAQFIVSDVANDGTHEGTFRKIFEYFKKNYKGLTIVAFLIILHWNPMFIDNRKDLVSALQNVMTGRFVDGLQIISATELIWSGVLVLTIDTVGRRLYLLGSTFVGLAIATFATIVIMDRSYIFFFTTFILHLCQIVFFGIPLVFVGELFPANVRSTASSMTVIFETMCISLCWWNDWGTSEGADYDFWIFIPVYLVAFLIILAFVPETKQNSMSDIQDALADTRLVCRRDTTSRLNQLMVVDI